MFESRSGPSPRRVAIYSRVSTDDQTAENQTHFLSEIATRNGWDLIDTYVDQGVSGAKGRDKRPQFDRLCKDMIRRRFDLVMVWDVSRLGRSVQHLIEFLNDEDLHIQLDAIEAVTEILDCLTLDEIENDFVPCVLNFLDIEEQSQLEIV